MRNYIVKRILLAIPTLWGIITLVFVVLRLVPGDPVQIMLGDFATPESVANLRNQLGLDKSIIYQYIKYIVEIAQGNFGRSLTTNRSVFSEIIRLFPYTLQLGIVAVIISIIIGVPAGIISAIKRNTWLDRLSMVTSLSAVSIPVFWLGIVLILFFSVKLEWFPVIGAGDITDIGSALKHVTLPAFALGATQAALIARMARSCMLEVFNLDFIRTARAKGLSERMVIYKHALRNTLLPLLTIIGLNVGYLLGGSVVIETVFARPGVGKLLIDSIYARDYIQIQGTIIFIAGIFVIVNILTDISYAIVDPRVRYQKTAKG